ncbi:MAG: (2Fe-2S) ferredoxin domain-containing protein [Magnetococcales bacterium]|nr:(2Fe-2S) ferredoxin domain-containing protein [Magnetococcales bacterium]
MLLVCVKERISPTNPSCGKRGGTALAEAFADELAQRHLPVKVKRILCLGECAKGPNVRIAPGGKTFHAVRIENVPEILQELERFFGSLHDSA